MTDSIYHVCNRGMAKGKIFFSESDYRRFVFNLYKLNNKGGAIRTRSQDLEADLPSQDKLVDILKWSLLPNHYHLLVYQLVDGGVVEFTKRLGNAYTKYFNIKYERSGYLFQNKARIIPVENDRQFLYLPLYVSLNPLDVAFPNWKEDGVKNRKDAINFLNIFPWSVISIQGRTASFEKVVNRERFCDIFDTSLEKHFGEMEEWLSQDVSTWHVDTGWF